MFLPMFSPPNKGKTRKAFLRKKIKKNKTSLFLSIGFAVAVNGIGHGLADDAQVKPETPVLNIPDIIAHPAAHLPELSRLATETHHLTQTRYPGLYPVTEHILVDEL